MMNDLISRRAVLNIVDDLRDQMTVEGYWSVIERIKALPSATCGNLEKPEIPQHSEGEAADCNLDCISRQMLLEYIHGEPVGKLLCDKYNLDGLIEQFPSAQPETHACDSISRQATIDEIEERKNANGYRNVAVISELNRLEGYIMRLPSVQPVDKDTNVLNNDTISRQEAIAELDKGAWGVEWDKALAKAMLENLPSVQPDLGKYEYHYDHTDCIWYRPEARNRCPVTCAQYRDGWNDAMNYIFRDGKGYRPYRRDKQYEE